MSLPELPLFFFSGIYVALSPCLFPIMPLTIFRIMNKSNIGPNGQEIFPTRKMVLEWVILLMCGILMTFFSSMIISNFIGNAFARFLINNYITFSFILGIFLIVMGIFMFFPKIAEKTYAKIPIPQKLTNLIYKEEYRNFDMFIIGLTYSFIALPCAFPIFATSLAIIAYNANLIFTIGGMMLFSIGLFIPYLLLVFVTSEVRTRAAIFLAEKFRLIEIIIAAFMIILGILFIWPFFGGNFPIFLPSLWDLIKYFWNL